jgi:hypothetical protein
MTSKCLARVSLVFRTCLAPVSHILERDTCETPARHVRDTCETTTSDLLLNYHWCTSDLSIFQECSKNVPFMVFRGSVFDPGCFLKNEWGQKKNNVKCLKSIG